LHFHTLLLINSSFLNEVLHYLQTSYLRVISGSRDHLENVSK